MILADKIRPYVEVLKECAAAGESKAQSVISLYQMHVSCPRDPAAPVLCEAAFDDWLASKKDKSQ